VSSLFLKTYFTNFINLGVSRVTGFPEFPNMWLELQLLQNLYILLSFSFCMKNGNAFTLDLLYCQIYLWSWADSWICCASFHV
jgi:hypothetical protein